MFSRFNLQLQSGKTFNSLFDKCKLKDKSENFYEKTSDIIGKALDQYIGDDGVINGSELQKDWFPSSEKFDVFLSHSHENQKLAITFTNWLYEEFQLRTFLDSYLWGYAEELLKKIDDRYTRRKEHNVYDYNSRNYSTAHVHMMLSTALMKMMDKTECVMLLNTPESINIQEVLNLSNKPATTYSPWIYYELAMANKLKINNINLQRRKNILNHLTDVDIKKFCLLESKRYPLNIEYDVSDEINKFTEISCEDLHIWEQRQTNREYPKLGPLDILYLIKKHPLYLKNDDEALPSTIQSELRTNCCIRDEICLHSRRYCKLYGRDTYLECYHCPNCLCWRSKEFEDESENRK